MERAVGEEEGSAVSGTGKVKVVGSFAFGREGWEDEVLPEDTGLSSELVVRGKLGIQI